MRDALAAAGLTDGLLGEAGGDFTYEDGVAAAAMLLAPDRHPTALIAINDAMALGALDHARSLGLRVPADLSVAGFDGSAVMHWLAYDLETMVQPVRRVAGAAAERLGRRIADPDPHPERRVFSYSLRAGVTVGPPSSGVA